MMIPFSTLANYCKFINSNCEGCAYKIACNIFSDEIKDVTPSQLMDIINNPNFTDIIIKNKAFNNEYKKIFLDYCKILHEL